MSKANHRHVSSAGGAIDKQTTSKFAKGCVRTPRRHLLCANFIALSGWSTESPLLLLQHFLHTCDFPSLGFQATWWPLLLPGGESRPFISRSGTGANDLPFPQISHPLCFDLPECQPMNDISCHLPKRLPRVSLPSWVSVKTRSLGSDTLEI